MDIIHARATDYVRANVHWDGGITGVMKIAAMAEASGLDVELHGGGLAHRHCMAAIRNTNYFELGAHFPVAEPSPLVFADPRWWDELDAAGEDGCIAVPDGPGLGVEPDWDWIRSHQTGQQVFEA